MLKKSAAVTPAAAKKRAATRALTKSAPKKTTKRRSQKRTGPDAKANVVETALAAFAHEVRTPLTGILAISSLLATSDLNDRERRWVETIKTAADHLAALATLFVDAARPQRGRQGREDFFSPRALAHTMGDSLSGRAAAKGLQSRVEIADDVPAFMVGDPVRLRAALENLIDNAVKFTDRGEVSLRVMIAARSSRAAPKTGVQNVSFVVADSGIGLSLAEARRLFRPFSQANVSIASRFGGAGLGLSSVRQLARTMGGDVGVMPRDGGGTAFKLTVMLKQATHPAMSAGGEPDEFLPRGVRPLHILSVEDNPFGRVVLNAILTELGHKAEFIDRGELVPGRLHQTRFDAVLMDMVLPGIGGIEAIKAIREMAPPHGDVAIVGVSGRGEDEAAARAAGADAFLVKPVIPRALATALLLAVERAATSTS